MTKELLIVGVSARAAAHSALRAGWKPFAIDPFNDVDLVDRCPTLRSVRFPHDIIDLSTQFPICPVMYTGAFENYPVIITALAKGRTILGNAAESVRAVRDPWRLQQLLSDHGLKMPEVRRMGELRDENTWLRKSLRSGGGLGIRFMRDELRLRPGNSNTAHRHSGYFQRFVAGEAFSAQYVARSPSTKLLGVTRQLFGNDWAGAEEFMYVGNIGAVSVPATLTCELRQLGNLLALEFQLQGLFGVDVIVADDQVWILEVNPRYTAAIEVLERSTGLHAIEFHAAACEGRALPEWSEPLQAQLHGKAVLYARETLTIPSHFTSWIAERNATHLFPMVADIPHSGSVVKHRSPICTIFAFGRDEFAVIANLQALASEVYTVVKAV